MLGDTFHLAGVISKERGIMSGAAGGGGGSCAAAAGGCSSVGSPYGAAAGVGVGVAGRLPARVLEHIFSYLELTDLIQCVLVCWHWNNILSDENSEVWRSLSNRSLTDEALRSDILCNLPTYKGKVGIPMHYCHVELRLKIYPLSVSFALQTPSGYTGDSLMLSSDIHVGMPEDIKSREKTTCTKSWFIISENNNSICRFFYGIWCHCVLR